jgi:uncharacterized protein YjiS (DUF1127 family)
MAVVMRQTHGWRGFLALKILCIAAHIPFRKDAGDAAQESADPDRHKAKPTYGLRNEVIMSDRIAKQDMGLLFSSNAANNNSVGLFGRLARAVNGAVRHIAEAPRRRAVLAELNVLSDRELADIGLTRTDLPFVFSAEFVASRRAA